MKAKSFFGIILSALIFSLAIISCNSGGTSSVTIKIDLGLHNKAAFNSPESSIIDRVLRFFAKDAEAAPPTNITSITLNITGEGMDKITENYPATQSIITIDVPTGDSRMFEILAYTPSATFRGTATRNLTGGATVTIPITMSLYETKIIIPDPQNGRLVQIDDMSGNGWIQKLYSNFTPAITSFTPYDVDFDSQGRIYIVNSIYDGPDIMRIDDITLVTTTQTPLVTIASNNGIAIAIDRINSILYYSTSSILYRNNLGGTAPVSLNITTNTADTNLRIGTIRGIAVDDSGSLYIAGANQAGIPGFFKYNPNTQIVELRYATGLIQPWDVVVKNGYLYAADYDTATPSDSSKIVQFTLDLNYITQLGSTNSGTFHGTHRFLAILNTRFYLIDEDENVTSETERIVAFDNLSSPITSFDASMVGQSAFQFYSGS